MSKKMAPRVGLEPTTTRLTAGCSTIELSRSEFEPYLTDVLYNNTNILRKSTRSLEFFFGIFMKVNFSSSSLNLPF